MIRPGIRRLFRLGRLRGSSLGQEVDEEIRLHIELRARELEGRGLSPAEAEREALRRFGRLEEERAALRRMAYRRERSIHAREWLGSWTADVAYGLRQLRGDPGFTVAAVLTLALGIGANTAIFAGLDDVLLRPPAHVAEPDELVDVYTSGSSGAVYGTSSYPDFVDFRNGVAALRDLAAHSRQALTLQTPAGPEIVRGDLVSSNYFSILGVRPAIGGFALGGEGPGASPAAVLGHSLWVRSFGSDPEVVGKTVVVNGEALTIVGVAPEGFAGPSGRSQAEVWVPLGLEPRLLEPGSARSRLESRGSRGLYLFGRLAPGATAQTAQAQLTALGAALFEQYPQSWSNIRDQGRTVTVLDGLDTRLPPELRGGLIGFFALLMALVALVLLVACANVANLLLARATSRRQEIAVRIAIGASRRRLLRQLLTEGAVLATLAGLVGVGLAFAIVAVVGQIELPVAPGGFEIAPVIDLRSLVFAVGASFITAIAFGLLPALIAGREAPSSALRTHSASGGRGVTALRSGLVIGQVATCIVLLVCAFLFIGSLRNAVGSETGFDADGVLLVPLRLEPQGYSGAAAMNFLGELLERVESLPGVESAALAEIVPLAGGYQRRGVRPEGYTPGTGEDMEVDYSAITPEYLRLMRIPLLSGRGLAETDRDEAPPVALVNEAFAQRFWPDLNPIGRRIESGRPDSPSIEVVGLMRNIAIRALGEEPRPAFYVPVAQALDDPLTLHVRTTGEPMAMLAQVTAEIRAMDEDFPISGATSLEAAIGGQTLALRIASVLFGAFGLLALSIAMVGLFGVLSYAIAQRTKEIGIRMALGARAEQVRASVVRGGMRLVSIGIGIGLLAAWGASRLVATLLFDIGSDRWTAFLLVLLILAAVALLASLLSARRATGIDPMTALRTE